MQSQKHVTPALQGGNARETTVAKMVEEVEAHALYERTSALVRATGSRRIPKLRPSPSSPTGWVLSTQQSVQAMPSHKLTKNASSVDSTCSSISSMLLNSEKHYDSQTQLWKDDHGLRKDDHGLSHVARQVRMGRPHANEVHTVVLGREADMLNACASQAVDSSDKQISLGKSAAAKAENAADVCEAIMLEEGTTGLVEKSWVSVWTKKPLHQLLQSVQSGNTRASNSILGISLLGIIVSALRITGDWWTSFSSVSMTFLHHELAIAPLLFSSVG